MLDIKLVNGCNSASYIKNKYTGDVVKVDCGRCAYCLAKKSRKSAMRVLFNSKKYRYCYFVTLTYNPDSLPLVKAYVKHSSVDLTCDSESGIQFVEKDETYISLSYYTGNLDLYTPIVLRQVQGTRVFNRNLQTYVDAEDEICIAPSDLRALIERTQPTRGDRLPEDCLPFANYVDVQNFIKRLKINLKRLCDNDKLSYYVVTEYGPQTLRPHIHMLLFIDSDKQRTFLQQACYKSWRLGSVDASIATGKSISYVAGYANSYASLPSFYSSSKVFKVRARASVHFDALNDIPLPSDDDALQAFNKKLLVGEITESNGKCCTLKPSPTVVAALYPRYKNTACGDAVQTARILHACRQVKSKLCKEQFEVLDLDSVWRLSEVVYDYLCGYLSESIYQPYLDGYWIDFALAASLINERGFVYSKHDSELPDSVDEDSTAFRKLMVSRVYSVLLRARNYFKLWRNDYMSERQIAKHLQFFYDAQSEYNARTLNEFYNQLQDGYNDAIPFNAVYRSFSFGYCGSLESSYLDPAYFDRKTHVLFRDLNERNKFALQEKIKHKKLNDSLGIFLRENNLI